MTESQTERPVDVTDVRAEVEARVRLLMESEDMPKTHALLTIYNEITEQVNNTAMESFLFESRMHSLTNEAHYEDWLTDKRPGSETELAYALGIAEKGTRPAEAVRLAASMAYDHYQPHLTEGSIYYSGATYNSFWGVAKAVWRSVDGTWRLASDREDKMQLFESTFKEDIGNSSLSALADFAAYVTHRRGGVWHMIKGRAETHNLIKENMNMDDNTALSIDEVMWSTIRTYPPCDWKHNAWRIMANFRNTIVEEIEEETCAL